MLIVIFGESCTGKSTLASKLSASLPAKVFTCKDYLRLEKNETCALKTFQAILNNAVLGEHVIYVISEQELLRLIPDGAIRILVTADLLTIKERFSKRMKGHLPAPVEAMLERNHGIFDQQPHDFHLNSAETDAEMLCEEIILRYHSNVDVQ